MFLWLRDMIKTNNITIISKSCFRQNTYLKKLLLLLLHDLYSINFADRVGGADIAQFDLVNSKAFKDLWNKIQGLSSTCPVFKYFQGLEFRWKKFKYFQGCVGTLIKTFAVNQYTDEKPFSNQITQQ